MAVVPIDVDTPRHISNEISAFIISRIANDAANAKESLLSGLNIQKGLVVDGRRKL